MNAPSPLQQQFARVVQQFERLSAQQRETTRQGEHLFQTLLHRACAGELIDGPNIWRLMAGDRVLWVGDPRPELQGVDSILAILDCRESALAFGESNWRTFEDLIEFGSPTKAQFTREQVLALQLGLAVVRELGIPRELAFEWRLG